MGRALVLTITMDRGVNAFVALPTAEMRALTALKTGFAIVVVDSIPTWTSHAIPHCNIDGASSPEMSNVYHNTGAVNRASLGAQGRT